MPLDLMLRYGVTGVLCAEGASRMAGGHAGEHSRSDLCRGGKWPGAYTQQNGNQGPWSGVVARALAKHG